MKHTISVTVENKPGVLARVSNLFSARGYNITSLAVSETLDPTISYMTIVVEAKDESILEQIKKQLNKLIDVITVNDFTKKEHADREMILVKVSYSSGNKSKLTRALDKYVAKVIQQKGSSAIIEIVGDQAQIAGVLLKLEQFGIKDLVRTGRVAMQY